MSLSATMADEWAQESAATRRALERIPPSSLDWRPHERSWTMGDLATHIANLPIWTGMTLGADELDMAEAGALTAYESVEEILEAFDRNRADAEAAIRGLAEERWMDPWTLKDGGKVVFTIPRVATMRSFVMNHSIHHRGQLTVYLRLCGAPVPQIYGPTADEP